jgi:hypothetical protein
MESLLVVISLVALVLAFAMSVVAFRLLRHGRLREAARIEALDAPPGAGDDTGFAREPADDPAPVPARDHLGLASPLLSQDEAADDPWDPAIHASDPGEPPTSRHDRLRPAFDAPAAADISFGATVVRQPPSRRWRAFAVIAAVIFLGVASAFALRSAEPIVRFVDNVLQPRPDVAGAAPLELLSLRHSTGADGSFTVTGLVQNPASGISLDHIEAVVYLFDDQGQYFASGRAELELPAIRPGDESPFIVSVPDASGVSRYRVGFRLDGGGVVGHVDRRGQLPHNTTGDALGGLGRAVATPASGSRPVEGHP